MTRGAVPFLAVAVLAAALTGCGGKGGGNGNNNDGCPEGHLPEGPACVPIFDDCPGPAEIPVLGGGCQAVGVTECATGFVSDGEGGCDPILPAEPCPPGTMEVIGETECQPVGVTECAAGFVPDGEGGCNAVLPPGPDPCPFGTMEVLGHTDCRPVGDCATGTWGNITTNAATVYVDQSADATGADGSQANPFLTIGEALAVVGAGGQIAVAAGEYAERLLVSQPVELAGRCAELVTIRGIFFLGQARPPLTVGSGGSGTAIRGVTLTGPGEGLLLTGARAVTVDEVQVAETGSYGIRLDDEAEASFRRVVVAGSTDLGIFSEGSILSVIESVVRDTKPLPDRTWGRGIYAQCASGPACGSLTVIGSLVAGNRELGIVAFGVDAAVTATVVRDTLPQESDRTGGVGIAAQCDPDLFICGTLTVAGSLVAGNRQLGIFVGGVDGTVTGTVVRDTLPELRNGTGGGGIAARCDQGIGACGSLTVTESLVAGNRQLGIATFGAGATVISTVIRDTLSQESDGTGGRGISAQCDAYMGSCGRLTVTGSLLAGNRDLGIFSAGLDATITGTVVRDTLCQDSDGGAGRGIEAQCNTGLGSCGSLTVNGSVVSGNREVGIVTFSVDGAVTATVVRDTLPQESDGEWGRGINAQCEPEVNLCGNLTVVGSLVAGNAEVGIGLIGSDGTVAGTVVRDTLPQESGPTSGRGINAQCDERVVACGRLTVTESLVAGSGGLGIFTAGADAVITGTIVRDTLPQQSDGRFGRGINVQCDPRVGACGSLTVTGSFVAGSRNAGVYIGGVPATLEGVVVVDTRPNEEGPSRDEDGQGVWALCDLNTYDCATLDMTSCLVSASYSAGVAVQGVSGVIESSVVEATMARPDGKYGYGVQIEGVQGGERVVFDVGSCWINSAVLAGILYHGAAGAVSRSVVEGGQYSVVMSVGANPEIAGDNSLSGTVQDEPMWANLDPSPAPPPALPMEPVGQ